ncbi:hypothetical protein TIFTF001_026149 [Ficus carica]|uniref:Retrotransposon gag domain-containing protein n=1 Tax=Ficus carica TaxID=3494 RepID=A0AA88DKQ5_FICCA|nr:hypothetical protein TIFTF001_026149 [Ficus carica]
MAAPYPARFKMSTIAPYDGSTDADEHLENYQAHMLIQNANEATFCKAFCLTLTGTALLWYRRLIPRTMDSFRQLSDAFLAAFLNAKTRKKDTSYLFRIKQDENEHLKGYLDCFDKTIAYDVPPTFAHSIGIAQKHAEAEEYIRGRNYSLGETLRRRYDPLGRKSPRRTGQTRSEQPRRPPTKLKLHQGPKHLQEGSVNTLPFRHEGTRAEPDLRQGTASGPTTDQDRPCPSFANDEANKLLHPHIDALVEEIKITDNIVRCVLIDNGRSANILFMDAFTKFKIGGAVLTPIQTLLYGFASECVRATGFICLLITIGDGPEKATRIVEFLVIDKPSVYNAILGRPTLNALKAVVSTYHLALKFPILNRVRIFRGN